MTIVEKEKVNPALSDVPGQKSASGRLQQAGTGKHVARNFAFVAELIS